MVFVIIQASLIFPVNATFPPHKMIPRGMSKIVVQRMSSFSVYIHI